MRTNIKFHELKGRPIEEQRLMLRKAIDLELRYPAVLADVFGKQPHLLNPRRFASNDARYQTPANFDAQKSIFAHLSRDPSRLLNGDVQREVIGAGGVAAAKSLVFGEKYATGSDNPILFDLASQFAAFFHSNMPDIDTGYMALFDLVDMRNMTHDHFDIDDTNAGITFKQLKPGEAIKPTTAIAESRLQVFYLTMGAGISILDEWLQFQQYWKIDDFVAEFIAKYYDQMANTHYSLFTALGNGINVPFTTDAATTLNVAGATILRNLRNQGYGISQNTAFKILCAPEKVGVILATLEAQRGSMMVQFGTMKQPVAYTIDAVISSTFIPANDTGYYLVLPGKKLKRGVWKDLSVENLRNPAMAANDQFARGQYNAAIGDTNQVRRVLYS